MTLHSPRDDLIRSHLELKARVDTVRIPFARSKSKRSNTICLRIIRDTRTEFGDCNEVVRMHVKVCGLRHTLPCKFRLVDSHAASSHPVDVNLPSNNITENQPAQWPVWVKRVVLTVGCSLPVYPDERTYSESVGTSQRCHFRTSLQTQLPLGSLRKIDVSRLVT